MGSGLGFGLWVKGGGGGVAKHVIIFKNDKGEGWGKDDDSFMKRI